MLEDICIFMISQFFLFRYTSVSKVALFTKLYDYAKWIKHNKAKVLIMGSSHARNHISPNVISNISTKYNENDIFNVGAGASSPYAMYITYIKNQEKFKNLELVYYALSPHMLSEKYFLYLKYEKIFLNFKQWKYFLKNHYSYLKKYHIPVNLFFFPIVIFYISLEFKRKIFSGRNHGFSPLKHEDFLPTKENTIAKYIYEPIEVFPVSIFQVKYLLKLKNIIEQNGGKFILFLSPTFKWYEFYKKEAVYYDKSLVEELNKYIKDSCIIGSLNHKKYNLGYDCFYDDTHLSKKGAMKFTKEIFRNIDLHEYLQPKPLKALYEY